MNLRQIYKRVLELEKIVLEQNERIEANEKQSNHFQDKMNERITKIEKAIKSAGQRRGNNASRVQSPATKGDKQPAGK